MKIDEKTNIAIVEAICSILDKLSPQANGKFCVEFITFVQDCPGHDRRYSSCAGHLRRVLKPVCVQLSCGI